jgi:WD40 repeat protein
MRITKLLIVFLLATLLAGPAFSQRTGNAQEPIGESPYDVVSLWHEPFAERGFAFGGNSGIWAESADRIIIAQRGETVLPFPIPDDFLGFAGDLGINTLQATTRRTWQNCLFTVNGDGELQELWTQWDYLCEGSEGPGPHRIRISPYDSESRVWLINETFHQIYVFSNDGSELLATYGEKLVSGDDETHFGRPQDIAFLPDGRILIADGLDNNRIMIMDNDMNYLGEFGSEGSGPGQTNTIHAVAVGPNGLIFVLDRSGGGVNIWETTDDPVEFEFLRRIDGLTLPLDIIVNENDFWITDLGPLRFVNYDFDGNLKYTWLVPRELPDGYIEVHTFSVDPEGNLYGGDNQYGRTQKFVPKAGSSAELLIEPPWSQ